MPVSSLLVTKTTHEQRTTTTLFLNGCGTPPFEFKQSLVEAAYRAKTIANVAYYIYSIAVAKSSY